MISVQMECNAVALAMADVRKDLRENFEQDGRLTGIFFAQLQIFYQLLQTVKNETTVLNLVFKGFLQTSIPPLISIFYARFSVEIFLSHSAEKIRR